MKRRDFLTLSLALISSAFVPEAAFAAIGGETVNPSLKVERDGNLIVITDVTSGEVATVECIDNNEAVITWADGSSSILETVVGGSVTLDGEIVGTCDNAPGIQPSSVPSGYKLLKRIKTSVETYKPATDLAALIVTHAPVIGIAAEIGIYLHSLYGQNYSKAYVIIEQYYHPSTYYYYTVVSIYKKSNYTGLLKKYEDGPRAPV